jgi:hypothetical protein
MGEIKAHSEVLLLLAAFTRYDEGFEWIRATIEEAWGAIALESSEFSFDQTEYYTATMGTELRKKFFVLDRLHDPAQLAGVKHQTNTWEESYQARHAHPETRPLNLDPGYLTEAKLVLATTKDRDHRVYLDKGIFAEITLFYSHGKWQSRPWTYPDYQAAGYHEFFTRCRELLREKYR